MSPCQRLAAYNASATPTCPLRLAFVFPTALNDNGWSQSLNRGRLHLEQRFTELVDATTVAVQVPEGEHDARQRDKGRTLLLGTPVPETNTYHAAFALLKGLCDEDYDMVFVGSFGYHAQTIDVSNGYAPCRLAINGGRHHTRFVHVGGFHTNELMSTVFVRAYQMRYLAGLVAGAALATPRGQGPRRSSTCVGYIAAFPIPEVMRGINAFSLRCRRAFASCVVKVIWTGSWHAPAAEASAAHFIHHEGACDGLAQHSDTPTSQAAFAQFDGFGIGYNSDSRELGVAGDTVLTSPMLEWGPVFARMVESVLDGSWVDSQQVLDGLAESAVGLASFSPRVARSTIAAVASESQALRAAAGSAAQRHVFCGPLLRRWVFAISNGSHQTGCGGQPVWQRLDPPQHVDLSLYEAADGRALPVGLSVARATDCLSTSALLDSSHDFRARTGCELTPLLPLAPFSDSHVERRARDTRMPCVLTVLEGVELFEPVAGQWGAVHSESSHACFTRGRAVSWPTGDRFYATPLKSEAISCADLQTQLEEGLPVEYMSCHSQPNWALQTFLLTISVFVFFYGVFVCIWIVLSRHHLLLASAQPIYLFSTVAGGVISISAILPIRPIVANQGYLGLVSAIPDQPDGACNYMLWLYCAGFALSTGSLFARLLRAQQTFMQVTSDSSVTPRRFTGPIVVFLVVALELGVLIAFRLLGPAHLYYESDVVEWKVEGPRPDYLRTDPLLSVAYAHSGTCTNSTGTYRSVLVVVAMMHLCLTFVALVLRHRAGDVPRQFLESGPWTTLMLAIHILADIVFITAAIANPVSHDRQPFSSSVLFMCVCTASNPRACVPPMLLRGNAVPVSLPLLTGSSALSYSSRAPRLSSSLHSLGWLRGGPCGGVASSPRQSTARLKRPETVTASPAPSIAPLHCRN